MSRYTLPALQPTHAVTVGYDPPLATFWANVEDLTMTDVLVDPYVLQVGQRLGHVPTVEALATALAPYALLPLDILIQLRADQLVPYQRSALQECMVQFCEQHGASMETSRHDVQVELALEWFQARPTRERTAETLAAIVDHGCAAHGLSATATAHVQVEALIRATLRGLLPRHGTRSTPG